jgi:hypothetical protein
MLYFGHFTFEGQEENRPTHGYFTCVVDAHTPDLALKKIKRLLRRKGEYCGIFDRITVWTDTLIEISKLPKHGIIAYYMVSSGEGETAIDLCTVFMGTGGPGCKAYAPEEEVDSVQKPFLIPNFP